MFLVAFHLNQHNAEIINETPLSRIGTPKDVVNAIYFLCSENASFITGQTLTIDGGWTL
jgi:3-oxoacyl-[acyl-carrier protein] reductase